LGERATILRAEERYGARVPLARGTERNVPRADERGLVGRVVSAIGQAIVSGLIAPNHVLPTEAELGRQFGVSRTVVREATRILASKGLLEARSRTGTRVCEPGAWHLLDPALLTWQSLAAPQDRFVRELFELRRMIEPEAAAFAARRISETGLVTLASAYDDMIRAGEDLPAFLAADRRFHRAIFHSVGNGLVLALASAVEQALELSLQLSLPTPRGQQQSVPLHGAVLDAIRGRDPDAARAAMHHLIDNAEEDVRHALAGVGRWPGQRDARE
jgi:GntR family galactonate operon transcriptional repressor